MTLIWGIAAIVIYFGIILVLAKDAMDQIRGRHDEWKIVRSDRKSHHWKI